MSSINIVGYNTQRVSLAQINGRVFGAVMLLVVVLLFAVEVGGMMKGAQKQNSILGARYAAER